MAICDTCGNDYDKPIRISMGDGDYLFDCFECAIHKLAPQCAHCGCRVIGHGVEAEDVVFCCANCASHEGIPQLQDRV